MVLYVEACESGSMFKNLLSKDMNGNLNKFWIITNVDYRCDKDNIGEYCTVNCIISLSCNWYLSR